jgi:hypothetical protein
VPHIAPPRPGRPFPDMDGAPDPNRRLATGAARLPSFHLSADFPAGAASFEPVVLRCRYPVATTVLSRVMKPPAGNEPLQQAMHSRTSTRPRSRRWTGSPLLAPARCRGSQRSPVASHRPTDIHP